MAARQDGVLRRSLRRFTLGSGPLKRRSDRVQVVGRLVVLLSLLIAPPIAVAVADAMTAHLQQVAATEAAERAQIPAVLLTDAPEAPARGTDYTDAVPVSVPVRATWSPSAGGSREGFVMAPPGSPAGTAVRVWVDQNGELTAPPLDPGSIPNSAVAVGALPLVGVPAATALLYGLFCAALNAHRDRRWGRDWATVEPVWTSELR